jgi:hypothetical protein
MWDEMKQGRLSKLREAAVQGSLTEVERAELAALIADRCREEEAAILRATEQSDKENARLAERVQEVQAQNRQLEALIHEQKAYLADVEAVIAQMEERRRNWRERYTQVTGKPLGEAVTVE